MGKEQSSVSEGTIGSRILEVCELVGGKRKLANMVEISESQLYRYITNASQPTIEPVVEMAKAGGVSLQWLATGEGPKHHESSIASERQMYELSEPKTYSYNTMPTEAALYREFQDEYALIPVYQVAVSAGNGSFVGDEYPQKHLAFRRRWLKWRGFDEHDLAVVMANGDSMEPTIPNKSTLVVHTGHKQPKDGNIYVIRNGDQVWVKRIQVKPGSWLLLSENKLYPPIEIPMTEQGQFEIIGQVVHISRDVGE
ncbi:helix-turn-helix transcriptional regulator [Shewanella avicenniae]|uniref:Helix-turn-helix transcriptional regulator n=1 Tax=Shewanella avicenniae TaxID=2814294 RepID=A0ABX7QNS6_9GAMM|nr:helix-turn-helix transcriptional regulator [Shewanella avicenniae]QSX32591.1 helix-turn-helix transcriptional regulator [Shewanella avicenniae]